MLRCSQSSTTKLLTDNSHPEATVVCRLLSADYSCELLTNLLVGSSVEQAVEFCGVSKLNLDDPVLVSILVDEFGLALECVVDFDDGTANG